ncbi:kinase-like protein [Xylaria acuta]|nr:kinase-like protein [Xylaria acuta]
MSIELKVVLEQQNIAADAKNQRDTARCDAASLKGRETENKFNLCNQGSHHSVHLGDILIGKYEVVHKLGNGGFGLVWLCHNIVANEWRALRKGHILMPLEQFWVEGPNGSHYYIVLPDLGPPVTLCLDTIQGRRAKPEQVLPDFKKICTKIAQTPQNIMMGVEGLDDLDKNKMVELLEVPETCKVETKSGRPPAPCQTIPSLHRTNPVYAAPEVIWGTAFRPGPHSDIWSLEATFFETINRHISFEYFLGGLPEPYRSIHRTEWRAANGRPNPEASDEDRDELQPMNRAVWEILPLKFSHSTLLARRTARAKETDYMDHFEAELGRERRYLANILKNDIPDEEQYMAIKYKYLRKDVVELTDLFRKMLRYDPAKRTTINDVIHHPSLDALIIIYGRRH